jgi:hypothetical protein
MYEADLVEKDDVIAAIQWVKLFKDLSATIA